jgi:hypothetical protein
VPLFYDSIVQLCLLVLNHNTQHNDIRHNDIQHKELIHDTQHKCLSITTLYQYAECRVLFVVILSVIILSDVKLNVIMLSVMGPVNRLAYLVFLLLQNPLMVNGDASINK